MARSDASKARNWKRIACGLLRARRNDDEQEWAKQSSRADLALSVEAHERRRARLEAARAAATSAGYPAGKRSPDHARLDGRCSGCLRKCLDQAGAYCPTCRGRGGAYGWCECGAALYKDGHCRKGAIHRAHLIALEKRNQ